ncbi:MAG: hypothetical protein ACEPOW_12705 [Bacteroidales bacterium]
MKNYNIKANFMVIAGIILLLHLLFHQHHFNSYLGLSKYIVIANVESANCEVPENETSTCIITNIFQEKVINNRVKPLSNATSILFQTIYIPISIASDSLNKEFDFFNTILHRQFYDHTLILRGPPFYA